MNQIKKLKELITEAKNHNFENNCYTKSDSTFCMPKVDLLVWIADCEDFIKTNFGIRSEPFYRFNSFNIHNLKGNYQDTFDKEIAVVISALKICERIYLQSNPEVVNEDKISNSKKMIEDKKMNFSQVFIVHGHDENAKILTARFVERLGFEAIILHEQVSSSKTIIEKIEEYSNVGFGIILYTPCDLGGKTATNLKSRARQNVIFEHGFLIGKIGRSNVCALVKGDVETPNDISGVVYVTMDEGEGWCLKVAKELKKAGYDVDLNKL